MPSYEELVDSYVRRTSKRLGVRDDMVEGLAQEFRTMSRGRMTAATLDDEVGLDGCVMLDVGSGVGDLAAEAVASGADVYTVEPDREAAEIASMILPRPTIVATAENLPFPDEMFDLVSAHQVLEHVQDMHRAIDEMKRVCKPDGWLFVSVPNYLFPYEGHYRIPWLPLPRRLMAVFLRLRGRDPDFLLHGIRYTIHPLMILAWRRHGLRSRNLTRERLLAGTHQHRLYRSWVWRTLALRFGLYPNITWLLKKR